jgi:hypothetical protein
LYQEKSGKPASGKKNVGQGQKNARFHKSLNIVFEIFFPLRRAFLFQAKSLKFADLFFYSSF